MSGPTVMVERDTPGRDAAADDSVGSSGGAGNPPTGDLSAASHVLDNASVALSVIGADGTVLFCNESFGRTCGRPVGELTGSVLAESVVADDRTDLRDLFAELFTDAGADSHGDPEADLIVRFVGVDGRVRPTRLDLAVLRGEMASALAPEVPPDAARVAMCVASEHLQNRRSDRNDRLARMAEATAAVHDPDSGLLTERGIEMVLESAARRAGRNDTAFALIRCELAPPDQDLTPGHRPADEDVLTACMQRVRQRLRPADTVARSGQAIVVIAEDLGDEQDAAGVTYRVLSTVVEPVPTDRGPVAVQLVAGTVVGDGSTELESLRTEASGAVAAAPAPGTFHLVDLRS